MLTTRMFAVTLVAAGISAMLCAGAPATTLPVERRLADDVLAAPLEQVLAEADPALVRSEGGPKGFAVFVQRLRDKAGRQLSIDYERTFRLNDEITYDRVASFERLGHGWLELTLSRDGRQLRSIALDPENKAASPMASYVAKTELRLPFGEPPRGTAWFVLWGGDLAAENYHAGRETHFAIDFLPKPASGPEPRNDAVTAWPCWGLPILAAAKGVVAVANDGMADQAKLFDPNKAGGPGNHVVIDHGDGEFSLYGHLQRGSVRVRVGQTVTSGEPLGLCGNSGASEFPHLHFQLQTRADIKGADGLPPIFYDYFSPVRHVIRGTLQRGDYVLPGISREIPH